MSYSRRPPRPSRPVIFCRASPAGGGAVTYRVEYFCPALGGNACVARTRLITNAKLAHSYSKFYNTAAVVLSTDLYAPSFASEEVGRRYTRVQQTAGVWGNNYFIHITVGMYARVCIRENMCALPRRRGDGGLELCHTYSVLTANLFTRDRRPRSNRFDFVL